MVSSPPPMEDFFLIHFFIADLASVCSACDGPQLNQLLLGCTVVPLTVFVTRLNLRLKFLFRSAHFS